METANEGRFSSRICSERVDGFQLNSLTKESLILTHPFILTNYIKQNFISAFNYNQFSSKKSNQTKLALASTPFVLFLPKQTLSLDSA